ncbi:flagellar brake protein [Paraburkholderia sp. GAS334]|uniref:flagellar brake protein n=1 Tax=Paraburkholderia sp. GAS334 TaxID=3035131 RepID=UPI003D20749C
MSSNELAEESIVVSQTALKADEVPVATSLPWPLIDQDGTLLRARGASIANEEERQFLFEHFRPRRKDTIVAGATSPQPEGEAPHPTSLAEMHLPIGALLGVRSQIGMGRPMHPARVIGFAPNQVLFITPPVANGKASPLEVNENVDIVVIASQAVYRFTCTVEALCNFPFNYVVLSKPGAIRRLRERRSIRVHAHLAVRYGSEANEVWDGVGLADGVSALGLSLATKNMLGRVGERLRLSFWIKSGDIETLIETRAVIRNVQADETHKELTAHGLEFDVLEPAMQTALKAFVFDRQDDAYIWNSMTRT